MKNWVIKLLCIAARCYLRSPKPAMGKSFIWHRVLRPYVLWRKIPLTAVTKFGATLAGELPDVIHSYLYFFGVWEPGVTRTYCNHLRRGDVCIDIGANVGVHALLAAHLVGATGRVHAIEASPSIHRRLVRNLEANQYRQIVAHNVAVTDKAAPVEVFLHDAQNLGGTTIMVDVSRQRPTIMEAVVDGYPLSQILPIDEIQRARLIKIDVEGAEWLVLQGMLDVLPSLRDDCLIIIEATKETCSTRGATIEKLIDLFGLYGWEPIEILNSYSPEFYFRAPKRILTANLPRDAALLDLGFARSALRKVLLEADRMWPNLLSDP